MILPTFVGVALLIMHPVPFTQGKHCKVSVFLVKGFVGFRIVPFVNKSSFLHLVKILELLDFQFSRIIKQSHIYHLLCVTIHYKVHPEPDYDLFLCLFENF